ncbi:MAG: hypothetical protein FIB08_03570 [Candidatus Methanoperedens sp.]|nr:hypothetical protein [Candidatus Methanoperedens sp.]
MKNNDLCMDRRTFVKMAATVAGFVALGRYSKLGGIASAAPITLTPYTDPLFIPPVLDGAGGSELSISMDVYSNHSFHSVLPPAKATWGYGGAPFLGPTIEAKKGVPTSVRFINNIPDNPHPTNAVDTAFLMGMETMHDVRLIPHLHGGFSAPQFDGHPQAWFTQSGAHGEHYYSSASATAAANEAVLEYTNDQDATNIWYHDHGMGITRLNVYMGLAGEYFVRDNYDTGIPGLGLNIPKGNYEVPIVIQDRMLDLDDLSPTYGSLVYPVKPAGNDCINKVWLPEFFGDIPIVNGTAWPYLNVEPRRYRLRLLDGSNARFYQLWFEKQGTTPVTMPFYLIGMEQGLMPKPMKLNTILMAPGERADIIIDFTGLANGTAIILKNRAPAPYPMGGDVPIPEIMKFVVQANPASPPDSTAVPPAIPGWPAFTSLIPPTYNWTTPAPAGIPTRDIVLKEQLETCSLGEIPLRVLLNNKFFRDPIEETPTQNTVEIWQYINLTPDAHPMHMHLVKFQVLNRQMINHVKYFADWQAWLNGVGARPVLNNYLLGRPIRPTAEETGYKDTAKAFPAQVLRVISKFDIPKGSMVLSEYATGNENTGPERDYYNYVHHCHIIEHEDNEMMRPFGVIPVP